MAKHKEINKIQELELEKIKLASFNSFDGKQVVKDLMTKRDLWKGVIMDRAGYVRPGAEHYSSAIDLIKLRDISDGYWNVDTLYILSSTKNIGLELLGKKWNADEVDWLSHEEAKQALGSSEGGYVLRLWWD